MAKNEIAKKFCADIWVLGFELSFAKASSRVLSGTKYEKLLAGIQQKILHFHSSCSCCVSRVLFFSYIYFCAVKYSQIAQFVNCIRVE